MNILEKILEEIEEATFQEDTPIYIGDMEVNWYVRESVVKEIICSHMLEKEKVSSAEIISRNIDGKPYYGIKYKKVGEHHYTVGYGSYKLDYVIGWLNEYFEFCEESKVVVNVGKDTNVLGNDGWIPVEERLPEDLEKVLVWYEYFRYGEYNCMFETYGIGWQLDGNWSGDVSGVKAHCIAWQPLPEPYREDL